MRESCLRGLFLCRARTLHRRLCTPYFLVPRRRVWSGCWGGVGMYAFLISFFIVVPLSPSRPLPLYWCHIPFSS
ncbi:hypothetical protein R3P38DRAFT_3259440 [Favolaschia claudopus]|uniref:Uncharacterized protein n=1 Tax=Favolaschia claudopus TaxID=2862362 RepID=A0AAW0CU42_9AGAR